MHQKKNNGMEAEALSDSSSGVEGDLSTESAMDEFSSSMYTESSGAESAPDLLEGVCVCVCVCVCVFVCGVCVCVCVESKSLCCEKSLSIPLSLLSTLLTHNPLSSLGFYNINRNIACRQRGV